MDAESLQAQEQREKARVTVVSLAACLVLVAAKTLVGVSSNSLGVLSEAASSGLGLITAILTYLSVRNSDRSAGRSVPHDPGKIEHLSVLLKAVLLLFACVWIVREAVARLTGKAAPVEITSVVFAVLVLGLAVDRFRARAVLRVTRPRGSEISWIDGPGFPVDSWISATALMGVGAVWAGDRLGVSWLRHGDSLAALAAATTVLVLLARMGTRSIEPLLGAVPFLRAWAEEVGGRAGVASMNRFRPRSAGNRTFIDLAVGVPRTVSFDRVHAIASELEDVVRSVVPRRDVVVHAEPRSRPDESFLDQVRAIAQRNDLVVHELAAHQVRDVGQVRLVLDLDAEVDKRLTLREAHGVVDRVEKEILRRIPVVGKINTRLATLGGGVVPAASVSDLTRDLETHWRDVHRHFPEVMDCHDVQVRRAEGRIVASAHATVDGSLPVTRAQEIAEDLEDRARRRFPQIFRFTIHTEPPEAR